MTFLNQYKLEGCICTHPHDHEVYSDPELYPNFQEKFVEFQETLKKNIKEQNSKVYLRLFDGEFWFLRGHSVGNISNRHTNVHPKEMDLKPFWDGVYGCDYVSTQLYPHEMEIYKTLFPDRPFDFPMEYIYAIVANRSIFDYGKIGLICGEGKAKVIKELFKHKEYRDYIGTDGFDSIITVPERFACNRIEEIESKISNELDDNIDVYLYGIGISKLALAHRFKKYSNSIFIDIGCGMSAIAGLVGNDRPYFGNWVNHRVKHFDYNGVDLMDSNEHGVVWLEGEKHVNN
tara:strand:+ start:9609 stop:10475 length:867 start_codon:yes stop_codon:yes gene_type:complete